MNGVIIEVCVKVRKGKFLDKFGLIALVTFQRGIGNDREPLCLCESMIKGKLNLRVGEWSCLDNM